MRRQNVFTSAATSVKGLLVLALFAASLSSCAQKAIPATVNYSSARDIDIRGMDKGILHYINQYRKSIGLSPLEIIAPANTEAARHSTEMASHSTPFGHDGFDERIDNIVKKIGFVHASAENVAYGKLTVEQVVDLWLHSPGHKKNIEGNYTLTGIGIAQDKNGMIYYTQIFLRK